MHNLTNFKEQTAHHVVRRNAPVLFVLLCIGIVVGVGTREKRRKRKDERTDDGETA